MPDEPNEFTIRAAAQKVLKEEGHPLHVRAIHRIIEDRGYFSFGAKDPVRVLGVQLDRHADGIRVTRAALSPIFYRASPATYGLLEWLSPAELDDVQTDTAIKEAAAPDSLDSALFLERELHTWLYKNLHDNGLRAFGFGHLTEYNPDGDADNIGKFQTGVVGEMDMLLKTVDNDIVVIELKRRANDQTIGQICRYFGYAKECLCSPGQKVYGLILAQDVSESLRYALQAVSPDIQVRQLHLEVTLGNPWPRAKEG